MIGRDGSVALLDAFDGRRQLTANYFVWHPGHSESEQCEGCTWCATQVAGLSHLPRHQLRGLLPGAQGPYQESIRYHDFMGWEMPW